MISFLKAIENKIIKLINIDRYLPLQIDITNACNLKCIHCYHPHHKNEGAISLINWMNILTQYKSLINKLNYRSSIIICGGEPLTSPMLRPLLNFIVSEFANTEISILTNGTLIDNKLAADLSKYENLRFQISLDGPDSIRHDKIRGKGNFDKTIKGIEILKIYNFEVNVLSVLSKKTEIWMEDFFILAKNKKFNSINFTRFIPEGQGRNLLNSSEDEPLIGYDLRDAYLKLISLMTKYEIKSKTQSPLFELIFPGLGRSGKYWEAIVVDYQGYVLASSRAKIRLGSALEGGLENIFLNHKIFQSLRKNEIEGCGKCNFKKVCGGDRNAAFAASGDFLGKDPGCWKEIK